MVLFWGLSGSTRFPDTFVHLQVRNPFRTTTLHFSGGFRSFLSDVSFGNQRKKKQQKQNSTCTLSRLSLIFHRGPREKFVSSLATALNADNILCGQVAEKVCGTAVDD